MKGGMRGTLLVERTSDPGDELRDELLRIHRRLMQARRRGRPTRYLVEDGLLLAEALDELDQREEQD